MQHQSVLIIDFGSQYTQLIARKLRELNIYCEINPYHHYTITPQVKGIILSGSPASVLDDNNPNIDLKNIIGSYPVLAICYGSQLIAKEYGGKVEKSDTREYGRAILQHNNSSTLFEGIEEKTQVWMSHADSVKILPLDATITASTETLSIAAYQILNKNIQAIQFHPEVYHTTDGKQMLYNFACTICKIEPNFTPLNYIEQQVEEIKNTVNNDNVILGLSGGVDSSVASMLLHKAIGKQLQCIFINNGLLRQQEFEEVLESYQSMGLQIKGIDASEKFYTELKGIIDPEKKRKAIGRVFVEVFEEESKKIENVKWLAQGTIYPDIIESTSVKGPSATIKSHHNVGGLPEYMKLKLIEPLKLLFKDEVRRVGNALGLPENILNRHPFPGPGLGIRILGDITKEKVLLLQKADRIYIDTLKETGLYDKIWQAGAILLPVQSVGVMGDERTYEKVVALRAVSSTDGMTADWVHIPYNILSLISNRIINNVKGINRVVYDISSKPPATIEWE